MNGLGRRIQFDERSRAFNVASVVAGKQPRSYTWRVGAWLDQGNTSSCVGHAWAHELCARPAVTIVDQPYAMRIYHEAQLIDEWPGEEDDGTSILAGAKVCKSRGHIGEYRWAFGWEDALLAIGYAGPVVLGINWYTGMFNPDSEGRIRPTGRVEGGHAILANAVNVSATSVWLHNSWGYSWGVKGRAWLSWEDLDRLLHEQGEACVPMRRQRQVA